MSRVMLSLAVVMLVLVGTAWAVDEGTTFEIWFHQRARGHKIRTAYRWMELHRLWPSMFRGASMSLIPPTVALSS